MIRLLRTALLPIAPLQSLIHLPFSDNKKKTWIKKDNRERKKNASESTSSNKDVTDETKNHLE